MRGNRASGRPPSFHVIGLPFLLGGAVLTLLLLARPAQAASTVARYVEPGLSAQIINGKNIYLLAKAVSHADQRLTADRVMAEPDRYARYIRGAALRVPLYRLSPDYRLAVTETLFPKDRPTHTGWRHRVTYADNSRDGGESLWRIAEWFTGRGTNWKSIATYNGLSARHPLRVGDTVVIPDRYLHEVYRLEPHPTQPAMALASAGPTTPRLSAGPGELTYHTDADGAHARYRLRRGETLYTDVVVRFTGRVTYAEVMEVAKEIAWRSGIRDMTRIPAGTRIKIPLQLLSVEYRAPEDPLRQEYDRNRELARVYVNTSRSQNLRGVLVVLDSGHGGADPGAIGPGGAYEDEVCYDVAARVKRILEAETAAEVVMLLRDNSQQYRVSDRTSFVHDKDEVLQTSPPYAMTNAKVSVNLRWYLANSIYRKALARGIDPEQMIFTSFHADALHPAVFGAMAYIPGARYTSGRKGRSGRVYSRRAEVREAQYVTIGYRDRVRMEGRSRGFARLYINTLRRKGIPVHHDKPIRDVIYHRRRRFVPGVIRQNLIPVKVLVELVNLKNDADARRIRNPKFRQRVARAYVDTVIAFYGGEPDGRRIARRAAGE